MEIPENLENIHMNEKRDSKENLECASVNETKSESEIEKLANLTQSNNLQKADNIPHLGEKGVTFLETKSKKREYSTEMESQPERSFYKRKFIKRNCDTSSIGCDTDLPNSIVSKDESNESTTDEEPSSSKSLSAESETSKNNVMEKTGESSTSVDLQNAKDISTATKNEKSSENKSSSPSTSSKSSEDAHSFNSVYEMEENRELSDDSTPLDSSSCGSSSSSSDFTSMFSSFEEDEDDLILNDGSVTSEEEQNSDTNEEKLPSVLKKTLPADKFQFTKEILLRQINSGDSKRRRLSKFDNKVYGSRRMVQRLKLFKSLKKHSGCVNTVSFNDSGSVLISASDDRHVSLWDWARYKNLLHFNSGHVANVFQAKFLPYSNDKQLITCGQDHQIRMCLLDECGLKSTSLVTKHDRAVHKISMQPQMPHSFLSAGEDGVVYSIDVRENNTYCKKLLKVHGPHSVTCLYSIHCNPIKNYEFIVCGSCDKVRLYDQRNISKKRQNPVKEFRVGQDTTGRGEYSVDEKSTTVTCAVYNYNGTEIVASYNDYDVFLFNVDDPSRYAFRYDGHRNFATIKGVNFFGPHSEYVVSGSDCGYIYIWDKKSESIVQWMKGDKDIVNCLEPHPSFPILATSGLESDVKVWMPEPEEKDDMSKPEENYDITTKKEFQKIVKKNSYHRLSGSSRDDLGMLLFGRARLDQLIRVFQISLTSSSEEEEF